MWSGYAVDVDNAERVTVINRGCKNIKVRCKTGSIVIKDDRITLGKQCGQLCDEIAVVSSRNIGFNVNVGIKVVIAPA